jgi:NADH-quinone oxidoreductase subunit J
VLVAKPAAATTGSVVDPQQVGVALFGPYLIGVELASMLLLVGLIGAYYLGRQRQHAPGGKGTQT